MSESTIKLGGVPEHFNLPWHLAMEKGEFKKRQLNVSWTDFPGGTGQMCKALREDEVDVCVLLTEGVLADILNGNPSKVISQYVKTPLIWGIHTGAENPLQKGDNYYSKEYAISRNGSGSHLMAIVDAHTNGHKLNNTQFNVIKDINGALDSLSKQETDVFFWEKYTTKPYVEKGILRRISEFVTPWPCFVVVATDKILKEQPDNVVRILRTIHDSCDFFMQDNNVIEQVSERYGLLREDAEAWYHNTEWAIHGWVSDKMIKSVLFHLHNANIVDKDKTANVIWKR
jgi:sulfonate transport system substrate-binding protein